MNKAIQTAILSAGRKITYAALMNLRNVFQINVHASELSLTKL